MKKYKVFIPYTTYCNVIVEAEDSSAAVAAALSEAAKNKYDEEILSNLIESGGNVATEIDEDQCVSLEGASVLDIQEALMNLTDIANLSSECAGDPVRYKKLLKREINRIKNHIPNLYE